MSNREATSVGDLLKEVMELTLFVAPPEGLAEKANYYAALNALKSLCAARMGDLRDALLQSAAEGFPTKTGRALDVGEITVEKQVRVAKLPDVTVLRDHLESEGIEISEAFDVVKTLQMNPSKLDYLIEIGKLDKDDVVALHKKSEALKVTPSRMLKSHMKRITDPEG